MTITVVTLCHDLPCHGIDLDVVSDEVGEAPHRHVGEGGLDEDGRRSLGKLHRLNVHGLGGREPEGGDADAHQGPEVLQGLDIIGQ